MSASNGGLQSEVNNYFNTLQASFPYPIEGKLDTVQFLDAAKGVVSLIDMFGKVFIAVRYDMNGNIEKLTRVYESDKERFKYLHDMILCESKGGGVVATDALLWLIRGLHLFQRFFELILSKNQPQNEGDSDDLSPLLKTAYEETLCCHHGWMAQQFFKLLSQKCPNRTRLIKAISLDNINIPEDAIYRDMASFTSILKINIDNITQFYIENKLDPSQTA